MKKLAVVSFLLIGAAGSAFAGGVRTPEINGATAIGAVSLLSGAVLVLRSRRRK